MSSMEQGLFHNIKYGMLPAILVIYNRECETCATTLHSALRCEN